MPSEDVSDLRDVVDAINKLCETMKTSNYEDVERERETEQEQVVENKQELVEQQQELVEPEEVVVRQVETFVAEKWSDAVVEENRAAGDHVRGRKVERFGR
ncbi:unnamed protein product [Colias eurytheme]|nr:unnamed protein product [Colias eurytheme]